MPNIDHDCELEMDTNEVDHFLETGEPHNDMDKALSTMLELARKTGKAVCIFTVHKSEDPVDVDQD